MPIQEIKGLSGLRGWSSLSADERAAFKAAHPGMEGLSLKKQIAAYRNQQFIDRFGMDAFNSMSRQERDSVYRDSIIGDAVDEAFKDDDNYQVIKGMTSDSQYELLQSDYLKQRQKLEDAQEFKEEKGGLVKSIGLLPGKLYMNAREKVAQTKSDSILSGIRAKDNQRKADDVSHISNNVAAGIVGQINSGELSAEDFDKAFDDVASNSNYYQAFKNAHELQYYNLNDKIKDYAEFVAIQNKYGMDAAVSRLNTKTQQRVVDNQNAWDWWGSAVRGATGKVVASFGQLATGVQALYNYATLSATQGKEVADKWIANFLEGKDENGEDRPWYDNLKYWNGVDQFAAFSPDEINEIYKNGGISQYNLQTEAGKEMNLSSALNEGLKMVGYIAAQTLVARGVGSVGKLGARAAGGAFSEVNGLYNAAMSSDAANAIMKYVTPGISSALNAIPISVGYAKGSYDEVLQEATDRAERVAGDYVLANMERINAELNNGIELTKRGFVARKGSGLESSADELNSWVVNEYQNRIANGEKAEDIDIKGLYNDALTAYKDVRINQYYNEYKNTDTYKAMMEAARREAASAYERNATIEFLRMCGVNYLFKQYQQDKSVRAAMNSNYPNLKIVNEGGKLAVKGEMLGSEVGVKSARLAQPLKTLWGGFESNYMDDITAAYSKGFSLGRYNDYVNQLLDPDKAAATVNWMAGFTNALASAEGALLDRRSWYDGAIGALGSGEMLAPSRGLFRVGSKTGRIRNQYSEQQLSNMAGKYGMSIEQYINGEGFEDYVKRVNPGLTGAQITERANKLRSEDGFDVAVADGRIERLSAGEIVNNYVYNPLIAQYAESAERERQFREIVDGGNKGIADKKQAIEDMIRVVYATNRKTGADISQDTYEGKEAKAQTAFSLVSMLSDWMADPVLSQSEFVQNSWQKVQDLAKGNISEEDIADFYSSVENKSEKDRPDAADFAKQRLQTNAEQLVRMKDSYDRAMQKVKDSDNYRVIAQHGAANYVAIQLAFNEAMIENRTQRAQQLSQETGVSSSIESTNNAIAEFGTQQGAENALEALNEEIAENRKQIESFEALLEKREKGKSRTQRRLNRDAVRLEIQELRRQQDELTTRKSRIQRAINNNELNRTLSKEEILSLSAGELSQMIDPKNKSLYSKEQQAQINEAVKELELKDPNAKNKVRDLARLTQAIRDTRTSQHIMQNNMEAAADYFAYAGRLRYDRMVDALTRQQYREVESAIELAENDEAKLAYAKALSSEQLAKYVKDHPENTDLFKGLEGVAKTSEDIQNSIKRIQREESIAISERVREDGKEDTEEDIANKEEEQANVRATLQEMWKNIGDVILSPEVTDEASLMGALENLADMQTDSRVKALYDNLLEKLEKLKHARNATVVQERRAREEAQKKKQQEAFNAIGKNFGWDGYVVGDTVYHKDGREGRVVAFIKANEGESAGKMKIAWNGEKGTTIYNAAQKDLISKTKPEPTTARVGTETKSPSEPVVKDTLEDVDENAPREDVGDWTDDGGYVAPDEEKQFEAAIDESGTDPVEVPDGSAIEEANNDKTSKRYRKIPGLLEGNGLYRYAVDLLNKLGIIRNRTSAKEGDSLSNFFKWLDNEHIELQEIIDRELFQISKTNPDIQFMYAKDPLLGNHVVQVVEFTDAVEKIHDKDLGGVVVVGEGEEAKRYLVVGTTYSQIGMDAFYRISNPLRAAGKEYLDSHPSAKYFVHPDIRSKIANIDAGRLVKQQLGEDSAQFRKLSELFADPTRNPNKISFENGVFGIMYNDKFFVPNRTSSAPIFPPGKSDSNIGRVFLMIPAANGNYIPVALKTNVVLSDLTEGRFTEDLRNVLRRVVSPDLEVRRNAVKELNNYIVMKSTNGEVVNGFLVGNENHNNVTLVLNGNNVASWTVNKNTAVESFINEVMRSPFEVNITQSVLKNPGALKDLDAAGVLKTDVSTLRTANVSYQIFEVGADGKYIKTEVKKPVAQTQKTNPSRAGMSATIGNRVYRLIDGEYYDELNNVIEDKALRLSIHYNLVIQQRGLQPSYTEKSGTTHYIISNNAENPIAISRDSEGNITVLPSERAQRLIDYATREMEAARRREEAEKELQRMKEGKEGMAGEEVAAWDEETPAEQATQKPLQQTFIEPKHGDNTTYGPVIKQVSIHSKWEKKDINVELHTKTTTDASGTKLTKVVGWRTDGLEQGIPFDNNDVLLQIPDGYKVPDNVIPENEQFAGIRQLEERSDGTIRAEIVHKRRGSTAISWTTLERVSEAKSPEVKTSQTWEVKESSKPKPKSNYDANKATTKSLKELQEGKKVTTFGDVHSKMRKELNEIAKEKGWNWGKTAVEKQAFLKEKLGESFNPEDIGDTETFIENLKNCK